MYLQYLSYVSLASPQSQTPSIWSGVGTWVTLSDLSWTQLPSTHAWCVFETEVCIFLSSPWHKNLFVHKEVQNLIFYTATPNKLEVYRLLLFCPRTWPLDRGPSSILSISSSVVPAYRGEGGRTRPKGFPKTGVCLLYGNKEEKGGSTVTYLLRESAVLMKKTGRTLLIQHCSMDFHPLLLLLPSLSESEPFLPNEVPSSQI